MEKEKVLQELKNNPMFLKELPEEMRDDKEIVLQAWESAAELNREHRDQTITDEEMYSCVSERLRDDREVMKTAFDIFPWALNYASERLKNDEDFIKEIAKKDYLSNDNPKDILSFASKALQQNEAFLQELQEIHLELSPERRERRERERKEKEWEEYCKEIESRTFSSQESETLLSTLDELRETVKANHASRYFGESPLFSVPKVEIGDYEIKEYVEYVDTEEDGIVDFFSFLGAKNKETGQVIHLKDKYDDQLLLEHLKEKERNIFQSIIHSAKKMAFTHSIPIASELLCRDKEFMIEMLRLDHDTIYSASDKLKNDKEFMLKAIKINPKNFYSASEELRNDKDFMLEVIKIDPRNIYSISKELKNNKEFIIEAIKIDSNNMNYASEELKNDKNFMLEAKKINSHTNLFLASKELQNDKEFVIEAIKIDSNNIKYASEELKNDKDFMLGAFKLAPYNLFFVPEKLTNDKEFMMEAIKFDKANMFSASKELKNNKEFIQDALKLKSSMSSIPNEIFKEELKEIYQDLSHKEKQKEILQTVNPFEKKLAESRDKGLGR